MDTRNDDRVPEDPGLQPQPDVPGLPEDPGLQPEPDVPGLPEEPGLQPQPDVPGLDNEGAIEDEVAGEGDAELARAPIEPDHEPELIDLNAVMDFEGLDDGVVGNAVVRRPKKKKKDKNYKPSHFCSRTVDYVRVSPRHKPVTDYTVFFK